MGSPADPPSRGAALPDPAGTADVNHPQDPPDPLSGPAKGTPRAGRGENLLRAGARGVLWQGLAQVLGKVVVLLTTVVLARLLTPEEFGLVSLSLVLITYAEAVADAGIAQALVYLPRTRETVRAALVCSLVSGSVLLATALLSAPAVAAFFGRPDLTPLVRLLAVTLLVTSLTALPEALLRRDLLFPRLTVAAVGRSVVSGVVSIGLAVGGAGPWALAWGAVTGSLTYGVLVWAAAPQRPDLAVWRTRWDHLGPVLSYGAPVAGSSLLARLIFDVDYLIVGRVLGATALGYYTLAFRIPELVILNVFFVLSTVAFPVYSRVRDDPVRLRDGYLFSVRVYSLYGICAGVGLAVVAPVVVPVVFGDQWRGAVGPLVALSLYAALRSLAVGANEVYKALGRPGISLVLSAVRLLILVPALWFAARQWGLLGVAWAQVATSALFVVLMQGVAVRVVGLGWRRLGAALLPGLYTGAAVAVAGLLLARLPLPPVAGLAVIVLGGMATAVAVLAVTQRPLLGELIALVRRQPRAIPS